MSREQKLREIIEKHSGFTTSRRISGFVIDCNGCEWRFFTTDIDNAPKVQAQHALDQTAGV